MNPHHQLRPRLRDARDLPDKRIPFRVRGEVGQDRPHRFRCGLDVDLGVEFVHGLLTSNV